MKRPARIVTFCPEGRDLKEATDNRARLRLMARVAEELKAHPQWHPIDAVIFPGGFLSEIPRRAAAVFVEKLKHLSPGLQLVVGVDKKGEQLAVAFNQRGQSGFARKIFPVGEDVDGKNFAPITLHEKDFSDPKRFIKLSNGDKAMLCVCYDMFGLSDTVRGKMDKLNKAVLIKDSGDVLYDGKKGRGILQRAFSAHRRMIAQEKPDLALAAIHRFAAAGREIFWQRHGIASASAALDEGMAVGAAHIGVLPKNPQAMPLASTRVPARHLNAGMKREARTAIPEGHTLVCSGKNKGLLRLFTH